MSFLFPQQVAGPVAPPPPTPPTMANRGIAAQQAAAAAAGRNFNSTNKTGGTKPSTKMGSTTTATKSLFGS